jgi:hypothetical protein
LVYDHENGVRTRSSSILILSLAVLFAGEAVVALAHRAQRHVRCSEHGELIHVGVAGDPALALDRLAEQARAGQTPSDVARRAPPTGEPEHEHCFILGMSRERATPSACARTVPAATPIAQAAASKTDDVSPRARAVYRIAPKNSPPA